MLPKVDIVYAYGALDQEVTSTVASDANGLIFAGTCNGNVAEHIVGPLREATRNGVVVRNGAQPDNDYGWIVVDDQAPQKARILLMPAMQSNPTNDACDKPLSIVIEAYWRTLCISSPTIKSTGSLQ